MRKSTIFLISLIFFSCGKEYETKMRNGLKSCDKDSICIASFYFGEHKDRSAVKDLLIGIEDSRISLDIRHKGMSVYYCKMVALRKISGLNLNVTEREEPELKKIQKFINWAVLNKIIGEKENINTKSCVN
jgi:hypothetical protein